MSRLRELIAELCPDGVEYIELGKLADIGTGRSDRKDAVDGGLYPFYVRSQDVLRKNDFEYDEEAILVPGEGGIGQVFHYVNGKYALHQRVYRIHVTTDKVLTKFVKRYMESEFLWFITREAVTATVKSIRKPMIQRFRIPVPPIEVQREIVRILDSFQELDDVLTAEIEAREKQQQSSIDMMLGLEGTTRLQGESVMLSSLCKSIFDGDHQPPPQASDGIPFIVIADFNKGEIDFSDTKHVGDEYYDGLKAVRKPEKGDVILSVTGSYGISALVTSDQPFCFQRHVALLKPKCDSMFLLALMRSGYAQRYFDMNVTGAIQKQISLTSLRKMPVPKIDDAQQIAIAEKARMMSGMVSVLRSEREARRRQFAYYRDKLLDFPKKVTL